MLDKIILNVPYGDRLQAKQLGAKWDPQQKVWFVPPGKNQTAFEHWLPKPSNKPELVLKSIGLLRNIVACWSCKGYCTVNALYSKDLIIKPYVETKRKKRKKKIKLSSIEAPEAVAGETDTAESEKFEQKTGFFILSEISEIPDSLLEFLIIRCPNYRLGKVNSNGQRLYRNHCDHCSIGLSDARLHKKDKGFNPTKLASVQSMQMIDLNFFSDIKLKADCIDYTENKFYCDNVIAQDYLMDFI